MRTLSLVVLFASLASCAQPAQPVKQTLSVEPRRLEAHVEFLASDNLRGRDTGTPGYDIAAEYVAAEFHALGLVPAGDDGSYFQQVPLVERHLVNDSAIATISTAAGEVELQYPEQFIMGADRKVPDQSVSAGTVFAGYGIVSPDFDHDDYAGLDVEGKIVVILTGRPQAWPTEEGAHLASAFEKARNAAERGAVGLVALHTPRAEENFPYEDNYRFLGIPYMSWVGEDGMPDGYFPSLKGGAYLSMDAAALLFAGAAMSAEQVFQADTDQTPIAGFPLQARLSLTRKSSYRELQSPNVIAIIEGSDPVLKNEYLVYSGHLDHLGVVPNEDGEEEIYNGALDNAAGIATLLETARVLHAERDQLKRSVLFLAVTAEEKGLLGAGYFARHPTVPIDSIVANINLDMPLFTYPFADVVAFGAEHSTLKDYVDRAAAAAGIELSPDPMPEQGLFVRSDHYELVQEGVPAVFLVTGFKSKDPERSGAEVFQDHLKNHYHKPSDDTNLPIDYEAGALFTEININIGREVCNSPVRPQWNEGDFFGRIFAGGN